MKITLEIDGLTYRRLAELAGKHAFGVEAKTRLSTATNVELEAALILRSEVKALHQRAFGAELPEPKTGA